MRFAPTALGLGIALAFLTPAQAQRAFDGRWAVDVLTEQGACDRVYRYPLAIENGRIRYAGPSGFNVVGRVSPQGAVRSSITASRLRVDVAGRLTGQTGTGTWSVAGGRNCSGTWRAERTG